MFNHDGTKVVTASADKTAIVLNANTGEIIHTFKHSDAMIRSVSFSKDSSKLITGSDVSAKIWDLKTGNEIFTLPVKDIENVGFSPDGSKVVTASWDDRKVIIWNALTGEKYKERTNPERSYFSAKFSSDGSKVLLENYCVP